MKRNPKFDNILNQQCRRFEENQFDRSEWSYGYDTSLALAFATYFENLDDWDVLEWFEDDSDLEQAEQLREYFNTRLDARLKENHKFLMSNLTGGLIYG